MQLQNFLIIEDHHLLVEGYRSMLELNYTQQINLTILRNCQEAFKFLKRKSVNNYDMVFLDWILPGFEEKNVHNGGDLIPLIKVHSPNAKIVILTSHTDSITLYDIVQKNRPDALLCKIDFAVDDLPDLCDTLDRGETYYSRTVQTQLWQITSRTTYLDNYNRQIILLLSKGVKTKNLPQYLPLSISAIDKRKAQIRDYFLLHKGKDEDILNAAKKNGII